MVSTILPELTFSEAVDITKIYSVSGLLNKKELHFRDETLSGAPPYNIRCRDSLGEGNIPRPGEISLAHHGVLFLDELPEFRRNVLEALRQPIEDGHVTIARSSTTATYPAKFMLVAAMNPCPCGYYTDQTRVCRCTPQQIRQYQARISGPLLDRIDIHIEVPSITI